MCLTCLRDQPRSVARRARCRARDDPRRAGVAAPGRDPGAKRRGRDLRRPARDRAPEAAARQGETRAVRPVVRARGEDHRPARAAARRARGEHGPGGDGGRDRGTGQRPSPEIRAQAGPPASARPSAARAHRPSGALRLPPVRWGAQEARRGRHRDARMRAAAVEGGRARAREVHLQKLRGRSPSRRRPRTRSHAAAPVLTCSPSSWSRSTGTICRSPGRARSTPGKASRSTSRRWPIGWGRWQRPPCRWWTRSTRTCSRLRASMPTTPPCRCWRRRRPGSPGSGPMSGMTGPSPAGRRRRQRSSTRLIVAERIPSVTWPRSRASCRPMPMPGSIASMPLIVNPGRSSRRRVGLMPGANSTSSPRCRRRRSRRRP